MKVLVVGGGGREHAICWKLAQSEKVDKIFCAPGNAGIAKVAECVAVGAEDIDGICGFAKENDIDLAVIGPEVPLAMGIVDELEAAGVKTFGPNKKCSQLEASKSFTKDFLARHQIPTAGYKEFTDKQELLDAVGIFGYPMVLKADGLAAGKGVVIAENEADAKKAIEEMMGDKVFGHAADKIVVEEFLTGVEASMLCFVDENTSGHSMTIKVLTQAAWELILRAFSSTKKSRMRSVRRSWSRRWQDSRKTVWILRAYCLSALCFPRTGQKSSSSTTDLEIRKRSRCWQDWKAIWRKCSWR